MDSFLAQMKARSQARVDAALQPDALAHLREMSVQTQPLPLKEVNRAYWRSWACSPA